MKLKELTPQYLHPAIDLLIQKVEADPQAVKSGILAVCASENEDGRDAKVEIGLHHGLGHYDVRTVILNTKLMGDECAVASFRDASVEGEEKIVASKAYFRAPEKAETIGNAIWSFFTEGATPEGSAYPPFAPISDITPAITAAIVADLKRGLLAGEFGDDWKNLKKPA